MLFVCIVLSDCVNGRYTAGVTWLWKDAGQPTRGDGLQEAVRTSVIMPISDRNHGGNTQREFQSIITPVCACYSGPCVLLWGGESFPWVRRWARTWNQTSVRGNWSKKQCCDSLCSETSTCLFSRCVRPDLDHPLQSCGLGSTLTDVSASWF